LHLFFLQSLPGSALKFRNVVCNTFGARDGNSLGEGSELEMLMEELGCCGWGRRWKRRRGRGSWFGGSGSGAEPSDAYLLVSAVSKPVRKADEWKSEGEGKFLFLWCCCL